MPRIIYHYNAKTCRYEPIPEANKRAVRQIMTFLSTALGLALVALFFWFEQAKSLSLEPLEEQNKKLKTEWGILQKRIETATIDLDQFVDKDDHNYRVILDSQPLPASVRNAGIGGSERITESPGIKNFPTIYSDYKRIDKLKRQIDIEMQSFGQIEKILNDKIKMWASRPAIQPIDNRQLDRLHLTFGNRFHPIFKRVIPHKGLDFTASKGTPVYATGDGKITSQYFSSSYGNVIFINHGHGFETRYAHLSEFNGKLGQKVKRGDVIGFVGNTGNSVSAHLHYEVLYNGEHINPINFFQRDLSNTEYEKLVQLGTQNSEVLD